MNIHTLIQTSQTALITGGTKGIGFEVARALALAKARVLVLSRRADHGDQAVATTKEHDPNANVEFVELDLGDLAVVKEVADRICKTEKRLDIVSADYYEGTVTSSYEPEVRK